MFQFPSTFYVPMVVGLNLKILRTLKEIYKSSEALEYFQSSRENNIFFCFQKYYKRVSREEESLKHHLVAFPFLRPWLCY